ncbi:PIF1-like helicase [Hirsutella rhossiliensis]|uniref:ATP-dependent DNA helicase n=1 Tax=Hirsutella rhossiliensis TaxID=111463 RepID=A0A9P8MVN3_9HYPO|nr:PIF1-like helicase domain-containing protein [Hirsutella rhossiliensis]KAH0962019.1 PIF1-like helicase domain-containing protein [Hirsutella rhossiliensis]
MHLHGRLGCEHAYPDELKDLTPLEEKLISLNSCYGFVTKYSIPGGQRQSVRYPRHVKGHITVFPNDVQGLAARCCRTRWSGSWTRSTSRGRALRGPGRGTYQACCRQLGRRRTVPPVVCERLERNEPSARERTQTAQVVPPSERAMDDGGAAEIEEILAMLRQGQDPAEGSRDVGLTCEDDDRDGARPEEDGDVINEVTSSGMFPLDGAPDVADAEKIRFARDAVGPEERAPAEDVGRDGGQRAAGDGGDGEPYIQVRRGEDFADSADASFFAKAFPTLFPFGLGGPRLADEDAAGEGPYVDAEHEAQAWADVVLRRHGGRFATHPIFAFLVFNMGVRSKNRQASMLGVARKNFARVEGLLKSLTAQRLEAARPSSRPQGNAGIGDALAGPDAEEQAAYRERIVRYVDSVFSEELDAEGYCAMQAERSATADISSRLDDVARFTDTFDEEANFCAGATQIHTHSATCAPWRLVERTALTADGVLEIRRTHSMVNRWNRAMAVGLRHNHDISFIATQRKTMALIYYITNYATKVEDPVWKRVAAAAEFLPVLEPTGEGNRSGADRDGNKTRTFLLKAANRVFTERPLSQVEVIAHLLGYPAEFSSGSAWAYINANQLYWAVFRRWRHLRRASGAEATGDAPDETVVVEEAGLRSLSSRPTGTGASSCGASAFMTTHRLRRVVPPEGGGAAPGPIRAVESFLGEEAGDINNIWARARESLAPRVARLADNVQLLRRSAEDAKRDAKQWAATAEEGGMTAPQADDEGRGAAEGGEEAYRAGGAGDAARLIDVVRNAASAGQVTAQSTELLAMTQQLCRFQQSALGSAAELAATVVADERAGRRVNLPGSALSGAALPRQEEVRAIKSQQRSAARGGAGDPGHPGRRGGGGRRGRPRRGLRGVMGGFGEDDIDVTAADGDADAGTAAGELAGQLTLNEKQAIALLIVCRQLDRIRQGDDAGGDGGGQLCLFIGGEGGTGNRVLVTATSGTAAARINGITLHSACGLTVGQGGRAGGDEDIDGVRLAGQGERFVDGRSRMDWQEKEVLVIDEVSMLGARTLHAANEQLCRLRGSARDFGGIPVVILCGDFHQFRPVQERSILLPSAAVAWDEDGAFAAEQRRRHDKAHALWRRFTTADPVGDGPDGGDAAQPEPLEPQPRGGARVPERRRTAARVFLSEHKWRDGVPTEEEAVLMLGQGDDSATPVPAVFLFVPGMPVVVNQNTHQGLKLVNGAGVKITAQRKRPWQRNDVSRRGLPCAAAFACTDYKVQGGTLERVALELRGARMTTVEEGGAVVVRPV